MSEAHSDGILLEHIIEAMDQVLKYTDGMNMQAFLKDRLVQDGVIRNFMVMGEAVKRLSLGIREQHPDVEWKKIAGMRDKLVHDYMGIDKHAVWLTVERILASARVRLVEIRDRTP